MIQHRLQKEKKSRSDSSLRLFTLELFESTGNRCRIQVTSSRNEKRCFDWDVPEAVEPAWLDLDDSAFFADRPNDKEAAAAWVAAPSPGSIRRDLSAMESRIVSAHEAVATGRFLFDSVLRGEVATLLETDIRLGGPPLSLLLVFDLKNPVHRKIYSFPWERLHDGNGYLQLSGLPILRSSSPPLDRRDSLRRRAGGLHILAVPFGGSDLDLPAEIATLEGIADRFPGARLDILSPEGAPGTLERLWDGSLPSRSFRVLHLMGHGCWDGVQKKWGIELQNEVLSAPALVKRFGSFLSGLDLMVINGCHSGRVDAPGEGAEWVYDSDIGLASGLADQGPRSIIAHHGPIDDQTARALTSKLYEHLASGRHPAHAFQMTTIELATRSPRSKLLDWSTPIYWLGP